MPGQAVLVNVATAKEKPINVQLTIVENDPFHCYLKCRNQRKVDEIFGYETIVEIVRFNFKKKAQKKSLKNS